MTNEPQVEKHFTCCLLGKQQNWYFTQVCRQLQNVEFLYYNMMSSLHLNASWKEASVEEIKGQED